MTIQRDNDLLIVEDFTRMKEVEACIEDLHTHFSGGIAGKGRSASTGGGGRILRVSDVEDEERHQYVNLVQKGGGVLGVALVGYTYVLETMGIRFIRLAGTSAGAINAALMTVVGATQNPDGTVVGDKTRAKSEEILDEICNLNFFDLVDGHPVARWAIRKVITEEDFSKIASKWVSRAIYMLVGLLAGDFVFLGLQYKYDWAGYAALFSYLLTGLVLLVFVCILFYVFYLVKRLKNAGFGINPGDFFYDWIKQQMKKRHVTNTTQLNAVAATPVKGLGMVGNREETVDDLKGDVTFITSEIVSQNKIEFPRMANLFSLDINRVHPAGFVRASMAIPIFFESYFIDEIPCKDPRILKLWNDTLGIDRNIPSTARFVDGGVLSNFPLNLFFNPDVVIPRLPAFGIDLDDEKLPEGAKADNTIVDDTSNRPQSWSLGGYLYRIFNTVRFYYDKDFLIKNIFFKKGIGTVPLKGYNWLNFFMSNEQKKEMFVLGAKAAAEFLKKFDWESYKQERVKMYNQIKP